MSKPNIYELVEANCPEEGYNTFGVFTSMAAAIDAVADGGFPQAALEVDPVGEQVIMELRIRPADTIVPMQPGETVLRWIWNEVYVEGEDKYEWRADPQNPQAPERQPAETSQEGKSRDDAFWKAHNGVALVWSNPEASDSIMIQNALLKPSFYMLLEIAAHFGLERLKTEWKVLKDNPSPWPEEVENIKRVEPTVTRCLRHMDEAIRRDQENGRETQRP
jgi:hypothetical protein